MHALTRRFDMDSRHTERFGRHEAAALWIAGLLMLAGIALWAWWTGRPDVQPSLRIAGTVQARPAEPSREPPLSIVPAEPALEPESEAPAEAAPTF
ncbi:MAG TPA: hypothetical protein PLG92_04655 [Piscinibacter sp.]|nr:hypothetical protein [Piscinibacter sp.]HNK17639.1 hypothetical protein [Piscinibacter sp.]